MVVKNVFSNVSILLRKHRRIEERKKQQTFSKPQINEVAFVKDRDLLVILNY